MAAPIAELVAVAVGKESSPSWRQAVAARKELCQANNAGRLFSYSGLKVWPGQIQVSHCNAGRGR